VVEEDLEVVALVLDREGRRVHRRSRAEQAPVVPAEDLEALAQLGVDVAERLEAAAQPVDQDHRRALAPHLIGELGPVEAGDPLVLDAGYHARSAYRHRHAAVTNPARPPALKQKDRPEGRSGRKQLLGEA
jgi:hypothetical protein